MALLHINEAEVIRNIAFVMDRVESREESIIEQNAKPLAVLRTAGFAADVQAFIDNRREPLNPPE